MSDERETLHTNDGDRRGSHRADPVAMDRKTHGPQRPSSPDTSPPFPFGSRRPAPVNVSA